MLFTNHYRTKRPTIFKVLIESTDVVSREPSNTSLYYVIKPLRCWSPAFRFYVNRQVDFLALPAEAERYFADPRPFYCLMPLEAVREFAARGTLLTIVYEREGTWATSGRQLLRRRLPTAHFVVVSRPAAAVARDSHVPMR